MGMSFIVDIVLGQGMLILMYKDVYLHFHFMYNYKLNTQKLFEISQKIM